MADVRWPMAGIKIVERFQLLHIIMMVYVKLYEIGCLAAINAFGEGSVLADE